MQFLQKWNVHYYYEDVEVLYVSPSGKKIFTIENLAKIPRCVNETLKEECGDKVKVSTRGGEVLVPTWIMNSYPSGLSRL